MSFKCKKCKNYFITKYLLDKHINRKYPCDLDLQCKKCNKKFPTFPQLERHMNRKTPCASAENPKVVSKKLSDDEKFMMQLELEKFKIETEKELKLKELETKILLQEKSTQGRKELITLRKENTKIENSTVNSHNTIEDNRVINIQIINNAIAHIEENYKNNKTIEDTALMYDVIYEKIVRDISYSNIPLSVEIYNLGEDVVDNILDFCYSSPAKRCLFYIEMPDILLSLVKDKDNNNRVKELKGLNLQKELENIRHFLLNSARFIKKDIHNHIGVNKAELKYVALKSSISLLESGKYNILRLLQDRFNFDFDFCGAPGASLCDAGLAEICSSNPNDPCHNISSA